MDIDVLLLGIDGNIPEDLGKPFDIVFRVAGGEYQIPHRLLPYKLTHLLDTIAIPLPSSISSIRQSFLPTTDPNNTFTFHHEQPEPPLSPKLTLSTLTTLPPLFDVVALGGTFDHLHAGHKILLSLGAWIAKRKIIVGVTGTSLSPYNLYLLTMHTGA
jgi:pantetheine-phosphate adenylyltransferase